MIFKKASPSLLKILKFTMVLIIPVALIAMAVCAFTLRQASNGNRERLKSIMSYQTAQLDNSLEQLTYHLTDKLANDENLQELQRNTTDPLLNPYRVNQVLSDLQSLQNLINPGFSFLMTVPSCDLKGVQRSTQDSYSDNSMVENYLLENLSQFPQAGILTHIQKIGTRYWLLSITQSRGVYLAAWIDIEHLFAFMDSVIQSEDGFYLLIDEDGKPLTGQEYWYNYNITVDEDGVVTTDVPHAISICNPVISGFNIITVDIPLEDLGDSWIYLLCVLLLCGITIGFCGYLIFYFRHYIQAPLQFFQNHVNDYLKERRFTKRYGFAELDEVANAFSALEQQVNDLKIDIYEEKLRRTKTELEFLQNQIKPHFFVNCFNIIIGMAEWERFDQIQDFCMLLSSYVRYTLCDGFDTVSLADEISQCRDFLEIQNIRFDSAATFQDEEDQSVLQYQIPPLTILSLMENSIKHNKFKVDNLQLSISARKVPGGLNGLLKLEYTDNGVGLSPEDSMRMQQMLASTRKSIFEDGENVSFSNEHIGIQNVYRRLLLMYGERAKMEFTSQPNHGFCMQITLPCIQNRQPAENES